MSKARGRSTKGAGVPGAGEVVPAGAGATALPVTQDVQPFNARRLEEAREHWIAADWGRLSRIDREALAHHPDRGRLAMVGAAAALQVGDQRAAREHAECAVAWGCDRTFVASVLLASARHALGRASVVAGRDMQVPRHFERSVFEPRLPSEARRVARSRVDDVTAELAARRAVVAAQRRVGLKLEDASSAQAWMTGLVTCCLAAPDLHEAVDATLAEVLASVDDRVRFLIRLAAQLQGRRDAMTAVHFLSTAKEMAHGASRGVRRVLARQLVAAGHAAVAVDLLVDEALASTDVGPSDEAFASAIRAAHGAAREAEQARLEHGHELLLAHLKLHLEKLQAQAGGRPLQLVEIGTTRENVPGQGSTRKLAEFCRGHGIAFVTVDMDPANAQRARRLFAELQVDFEAVAMKGEDYLRQRQLPVDLVFLDAYDFDHGKHSELRQTRYLKYLGARIDEKACHLMHLDCAQSLVKLLSPHGLVCVDDTWLDGGCWTAKGTLAMPYLLEQGFELVDARNRAALLRRVPGPVAAARP